MRKHRILPFLIYVSGVVAVLSVVFPMIQINIAGICFAPTMVSVADASAFFRSLDINRVFGSLHLAPLVENVSVSLPIVGKIKLDEILMVLGDGTLGSITGPLKGISGGADIFESIHWLAGALYITTFFCVISRGERWKVFKGILSFVLAVLYVLIYLWLAGSLNEMEFLQNELLREVFNVSKNGYFSVGIGSYLYVLGMLAHAILLMLCRVCEKPEGSQLQGGYRK